MRLRQVSFTEDHSYRLAKRTDERDRAHLILSARGTRFARELLGAFPGEPAFLKNLSEVHPALHRDLLDVLGADARLDLEAIASNDDYEVRCALAVCPRCPPDIWRCLARDQDARVRAAVARRAELEDALLLALLFDPSSNVRWEGSKKAHSRDLIEAGGRERVMRWLDLCLGVSVEAALRVFEGSALSTYGLRNLVTLGALVQLLPPDDEPERRMCFLSDYLCGSFSGFFKTMRMPDDDAGLWQNGLRHFFAHLGSDAAYRFLLIHTEDNGQEPDFGEIWDAVRSVDFSNPTALPESAAFADFMPEAILNLLSPGRRTFIAPRAVPENFPFALSCWNGLEALPDSLRAHGLVPRALANTRELKDAFTKLVSRGVWSRSYLRAMTGECLLISVHDASGELHSLAEWNGERFVSWRGQGFSEISVVLKFAWTRGLQGAVTLAKLPWQVGSEAELVDRLAHRRWHQRKCADTPRARSPTRRLHTTTSVLVQKTIQVYDASGSVHGNITISEGVVMDLQPKGFADAWIPVKVGMRSSEVLRHLRKQRRYTFISKFR